MKTHANIVWQHDSRIRSLRWNGTLTCIRGGRQSTVCEPLRCEIEGRIDCPDLQETVAEPAY